MFELALSIHYVISFVVFLWRKDRWTEGKDCGGRLFLSQYLVYKLKQNHTIELITKPELEKTVSQASPCKVL